MKTSIDLSHITALVLLSFSGMYVLSQFAALVILSVGRKKAARLAERRPRMTSDESAVTGAPSEGNAAGAFPAVSIITSLKGPTPGAVESVRSILLQDYPAPVEIVFATMNEREPLLAEIREVVRRTPSRHTVKWVTDVDTHGLNPRTAKIHQAYLASSHPYVFMICVDTRFAPDYLRKAIELTENKPERYVTSFPVIDTPKTFSAKLEAVGLNTDVSQFFLISTLSPKAACAYGGAFLFSRELAEKCGAYEPLLKLLTDDITLAKALASVGGRCFLTDELAHVRQEKHSFRQFWNRQVRWRMIAKYFLKDLFWLAPFSWMQFFLLVDYVATGNITLLWGMAIVMLSRALIGLGVQIILETPVADWKHAWVLPIYDWLVIPAWCTALVRTSVSWGPTLMLLDRKGAVSKSIILKD